MAFFGLTNLGSQSPFDVAKETPLHVFERADFQHAFMQSLHPGFTPFSESEDEVAAAKELLASATMTYDQLPSMLRCLYKCPKGVDNVPQTVTSLVKRHFEPYEANNRVFSLPVFLEEMDRLKIVSEQQEIKTAPSSYSKGSVRTREYVSNLEFRGALVKHHRMDRNPRDKQLLPVTDTQSIGWKQPEVFSERKPSKSCEETRYAAAMVKAGVYYY
ncbi:TPA: hypothetical protein N0F65_010481 [Lagenidium giganteum]|uniref:Uncharacterized protein n=1 Tax=Lagenidium giganteum TaxID=4803 RepID=A0AAV2Z8M4_9STRA|nr:TPA: hypothetical protein N0F65_010481 [Lagenidium giganteum]